MYTFKPFVFVTHKPQGTACPKPRSGHRIVCDEKNLYSYGGFNPCIPDTDPDLQSDQTWRASRPLFKELWKFNLTTQQWTRLPDQATMPSELASSAIILQGQTLIVYGGTGVPFGLTCSNQLYVCNVKDGRMKIIPSKGDRPEPQYGQALVCHGSYLYTVGGTTGHDFTCDIHRLNLKNSVWETVYICSGADQNEPKGRYRHEVAFDGKLIYVLGGGTASCTFGFKEIPAFDLESNKWMTLRTEWDNVDHTFPAPRRCHGSVQYTDAETGAISVVISGGYNGDHVFDDVWKLDLDGLQWTRLRKCVFPHPLYFHSASITPEKRMYIFGGVIKKNNKTRRVSTVRSVWFTIPRLSAICWEALIYYFPHIARKTPSELLRIGIPHKFVQRIDYDC